MLFLHCDSNFALNVPEQQITKQVPAPCRNEWPTHTYTVLHGIVSNVSQMLIQHLALQNP